MPSNNDADKTWTWTQCVADQVLDIVNLRRSTGFTIADLYKRAGFFEERFPSNRHVKEKIRQQLQKLRDLGVVGFLGNGRYLLNPQSDEVVIDFAPENLFVEEVPPTVRTVTRVIRLRNTILAIDLKRRYRYRCQVCRRTLQLPNRRYAECHHLKPLGAPHFGPDIESNLLVLCPNHHVLFDRGSLRIDPLTWSVLRFDREVKPRTLYRQPWHVIDQQYLDYHSTKIFGAL
ncbi:MAG: HNH endonuclease [Planctomycetaceae bacterium]|nr:HNH endonuclease [Planctomycetaceae bacterium]